MLGSEEVNILRKKDFKIEIKWSVLQRIAEYYQFPVAVFLGDGILQRMKEKTRQESLVKKARDFGNEIKDLVREFYGD